MGDEEIVGGRRFLPTEFLCAHESGGLAVLVPASWRGGENKCSGGRSVSDAITHKKVNRECHLSPPAPLSLSSYVSRVCRPEWVGWGVRLLLLYTTLTSEPRAAVCVVQIEAE